MPKYDVDLQTDLSGPAGNAYAVMGNVESILKQLKRPPIEVKKYLKDAKSGDYNNLLKVTNEWVNLIDTSNSYPDILGEVEIKRI